jgi:dUTP pyrophosphatase
MTTEPEAVLNNIYDYLEFKRQIQNVHSKIMYLSLFVDSSDTQLKQLYVESATNHNKKIMNDPYFYDAGFDLFVPSFQVIQNNTTQSTLQTKSTLPTHKIDFAVKCCAKIYDIQQNPSTHTVIPHNITLDPTRQLQYVHFTPFYTYARSSISKTPLRLANNQGIIDAGYRGSIIGMFDNIAHFDTYDVETYTRLLQICAPSLMPIYVDIVNTFEDLGPSTARGSGGFGSTGV